MGCGETEREGQGRGDGRDEVRTVGTLTRNLSGLHRRGPVNMDTQDDGPY